MTQKTQEKQTKRRERQGTPLALLRKGKREGEREITSLKKEELDISLHGQHVRPRHSTEQAL